MTDGERAEYRAQGAFDAFCEAMRNEMRGRSEEYKERFWTALDEVILADLERRGK